MYLLRSQVFVVNVALLMSMVPPRLVSAFNQSIMLYCTHHINGHYKKQLVQSFGSLHEGKFCHCPAITVMILPSFPAMKFFLFEMKYHLSPLLPDVHLLTTNAISKLTYVTNLTPFLFCMRILIDVVWLLTRHRSGTSC